MSEESVENNVPKESLPEYEMHKDLQGVTIGIGESARKYGIPISTISRWVKRGLIVRIGEKGQKVLLDEADVAYCSEVHKKRGGRGRWLFSSDGTPYSPKSLIS